MSEVNLQVAENEDEVTVNWMEKGKRAKVDPALAAVTVHKDGLITFDNHNIEIAIEKCLDGKKLGINIAGIELDIQVGKDGTVELLNFFNAKVSIRPNN